MKNGLSMFVIALGATLLACASTHETASSQPPPSGLISEGAVTATATVEKIDVAKRLVTLRNANGQLIELQVDESVKNLPQVKKGDRVIAKYYESLAYEVNKPGAATPGTAGAEQVATAAPGSKPGKIAARQVEITTIIEAIDKKTSMVTLKGADGKLTPVKVKDPSKLDRVRVGDLVTITYSQAVAVAVEPAPK
jgi:Cu/Ag efflux protein CusF